MSDPGPSVPPPDGPLPTFPRLHRAAVLTLATALVLFHIYTGYVGPFPNIIQRAVHLGFALVLAFLVYPGTRLLTSRGRVGRVTNAVVTALFIVISVIGCAYVVIHYQRFVSDPFGFTDTDVVLGVLTISVVLLAAYRTTGPWIPGLALLSVLYTVMGQLIPGPLGHQGIPLARVVHTIYMTTVGLWGVLLGVSANILALLLLFGSLVLVTGGAESLIELGKRLAGRAVGGAGYVAIFASSVFGSITGSPTANAATTGVFTIPMMKRTGTSGALAAGTESAASSGSQLVPPILGAGAFIMAELLGVPYLEIAAAAILPAILYYAALTIMYALGVRESSEGRGKSDLQLNKVPMRSIAQFVIPTSALVAALVQGYTPATAAFVGVAVGLVLWLVIKGASGEILDGLRQLIDVVDSAVRPIVMVATILAAVAVFMSTVNMSGIGVKFSSFILALGGTNLTLVLLAAMVVALILGLGLPTVAAYAIAAAVVAPPLIQLGIEPLIAHMFVFYYAVFADITPPLCPIVNVTAAIADAPWGRTATMGMGLAIGGFVLPFMFVLFPALLVVPGTSVSGAAVAMAVAGSLLIVMGIAIVGRFFGKLTRAERGLLIVAALTGALSLNAIVAAGSSLAGLAVLAIRWKRTANTASAPA